MLHSDLPPPAGGAGGVRHQVARLSETLAGRGHDVVVHVLVSSDGDRPYTVCRVPFSGACQGSRAARIALAPAAFGCARYSGFDVVHAHGDSQLLFRRHIPIVRTFYGSARDEARHAADRLNRAIQRYQHLGERAARRLAVRTVGISRSTAAAIGRLDHVIPCGVDRGRFRPGPKSERPTIVFVGTMHGRKRGDLVARAFRETVLPCVPDARLVLIAPDARSEPGVDAVRTASDDCVAAYLRSAWVFTLPSSYEGFGVPYIEAMASGTAVVATPNAGARELLAQGDGGLLVSDDGLGKAISGLLRDGRRRDTLAAQGREFSRRFEWDQIAARYESVYAEALGR